MLVGSFVVVIVVGIAYKNDFCFVFFFFLGYFKFVNLKLFII